MWRRVALSLAVPLIAGAGQIGDRPGWRVIETELDHATLRERLIAAIPELGMGVVTEAGPTGAARARSVEMPENHVVGVFNNIFAVHILGLSTAAMIEAPLRFYVTEDDARATTLSWKTQSFVFGPYFEEGGPDLMAAAAGFAATFEAIAARALVAE
jgi:uncharacterized protein (DUF302 family)